jgi:hypothetical protein
MAAGVHSDPGIFPAVCLAPPRRTFRRPDRERTHTLLQVAPTATLFQRLISGASDGERHAERPSLADSRERREESRAEAQGRGEGRSNGGSLTKRRQAGAVHTLARRSLISGVAKRLGVRERAAPALRARREWRNVRGVPPEQPDSERIRFVVHALACSSIQRTCRHGCRRSENSRYGTIAWACPAREEEVG